VFEDHRVVREAAGPLLATALRPRGVLAEPVAATIETAIETAIAPDAPQAPETSSTALDEPTSSPD
jgi:hypothetical protein